STRLGLQGVPSRGRMPAEGSVRVGLLGAGNFVRGVLLPALKRVSGVELVSVCAATGLSARQVGEKFGFRSCATDENEVFHDPAVNTVVIATPHHLHAHQVLRALNAGKRVFCEKPLCLKEEELEEIVRACQAASPLLMVGYNRRFAPMALRLKAFLSEIRQPLVMHYRVNAGPLPPNHWLRDPDQGGGRVLGEVCHFVDFLIFLAGSLPARLRAQGLGGASAGDESVLVSLEFANGSVGSIAYVTGGDPAFCKESVEVFGGGSAAVLDDFRRLEMVRDGRRERRHSRWSQDKGHRGEWWAFAHAAGSGGPPPIALLELVATSLATCRIQHSRLTGRLVEMDAVGFMAAALARGREGPERDFARET
ncbi:MAG: Gfo/Idh/MocA family protein, partial [Terriglobales bacterium]